MNGAIASGLSKANATANLCFGRGCWFAESVTMQATVSIPPNQVTGGMSQALYYEAQFEGPNTHAEP